MSGSRVLQFESTSREGQSCSMAETLAVRRGRPRPEILLPGNRKYPDQERGNLWSPCSNCSSSDENNSPTAINSFNWDKPAMEDKSVDFGWNPPQGINNMNGKSHHQRKPDKRIDTSSNKITTSYVNLEETNHKLTTKCTTDELQRSPKKAFALSQSCCKLTTSSLDESLYPSVDRLRETDCSPVSASEPDSTLNERTEEEIAKEKEDLRNVAWFQAGIPREIALEVLSEKPEGSFIVRESTTKHGCYALSLRVPQSKNPTGIAHYLILRTNRGYKIKGFTKEFSSLSALITHHSVMPELLPCTLDLARPSVRDAEDEFEETEQKRCDIFSDIHWLMTDLEV